MTETIPNEIRHDLTRATELHRRASSDFEKCREFSILMSDLLGRLEDAACYRTADKVMTILLDCQPKEGAHCEKATLVGEKVKKLQNDTFKECP